MRRFFLAASFFLASSSFAQTTIVTGTVKDPNGVPYSGASIKAQLVLAGASVTGQPTVTVTDVQACRSSGFGSSPCQVPFQGTKGPFTLDSTGSFSQTLQDNALVTPAGTQWLFTITMSPGIPPPLGTGPQSFAVAVTITGASQSISSQFNNAALLLASVPTTLQPQTISSTAFASGTIPTGVTGTVILFSTPTVFTLSGSSCFSCDGQRLTVFVFSGGPYSIAGTLGQAIFYTPFLGAADKLTFPAAGAAATFEYRGGTLFYTGGNGFIPSFNGSAGPPVGAAVQDFYLNVTANGSLDFTGPNTPYGSAFITKGSAAVLTLTKPTAGTKDGFTLTVISTTAFAHTITTGANGFNGSLTTATFGAAVGNFIVLKAFNGSWWVVGNTGVVLT